MEMLELLETIRAEDASAHRLFSGEGQGVRSGRQTRDADYQRKLLEAATFLADVVQGKRPMYHLRETLTTSDFPLLFGDIIDRQVLGNYREAPSTYRNYVKVATVADFRSVRRFAINGSEAVLDLVPEQTEYPESKLSEARYTYNVSKYGRRIPFSWEAIINDDLNALQDIPMRFGVAARRSESKFATKLFVDANGPHASFFTSGNKNIINATNSGLPFTTVNPALSITALQQAMAVLAAMKDADSEPIYIESVELVVPPALEMVAMNILNATELWITDGFGGGNSTTQVHVANWMRNRVRLNVEPYIPVVASSANGNSSWFLFASVASGGRPALEMGFLRGHTEPELFIKTANQMRVGGGASSPMDGDFENDSIEYKVRHVFGGVQLDPKMAVSSNGSGS